MKNKITRLVGLLLFLSWSVANANVPGGGTGTGGNVTVTDNGGTVVLANGIVSFTINKSNGNITNFTYNGSNLLSGGNGGGYFYFDGSGGPTLANTVYTLSVNPANNGGNQAEVWLQSTGDPMDMAVYYDLLRGQQGIYNTMILTHQSGYADYPGAELRSNMYVGSAFDWLAVDPYRFRQMAPPSTAVTTVAGAPQEVMQYTAGIYNGLTNCKYSYSDPLGQLDTWGWASTTSPNGVWQVLPSHEYYDGGPMHRELTEHIGNTLLNMFGGGHYGFGLTQDQPAGSFSSKTFGPAFIYANKYTGSASDPVSLKARVLWADAQAQAAAEQGAWPYSWFNPQTPPGMSGSPYPQANGRATVSGAMAINDPNNPGASPVSLWVGLAPDDGGTDFQQQYLTYQFWARTGAGGSFTIPDVRPGTYNLWAFGPGAVGTFKRTGVTVAAGQSLNLGTVTWTPLRLGPTVWEIGTPDRNSNEFHNGEHEVTPYTGTLPAYAGGAPYDTPTAWGAFLAYANQFPNGVSYTVGSSNYASDWNYCQPTIPNGSGGFTGTTSKIFFNLASAPSAAQTARLYLAFASVYSSACILTINGTVQTASVMGSTAGNYASIANPSTGFFPPNVSFDSIVRLGSQGDWGDAYLDFAGNKLKAGQNEIDLGMRAAGGAGNGNGFEYDYVRLELTGYNSSGSPTSTPTKTNTPAPPTNTSTFTATRTATPSFTPTSTSTFTSTPTRTSTSTNTASFTSTSTFSATVTRTATATSSFTSTATRTSTPTSSFSPISSPTPTFSQTFTASNTNTPVPPTSTFTFTNTRTSTPANTPTSTNSNTPVPPTASFTLTSTRTNTPTNTPVPPSATFTQTNSNTPVPPSATATNSTTPTSTRTNTLVPPTATFTNTNSPVPPTSTPTAAPSTPTSTNTPIPPTATASMTPTPTLTPTNTATSTASLTATPSATPSFTKTHTPVLATATFTATSTFTSTATNTNSSTPTSTKTNTPVPPTFTFTASMTPSATATRTVTSTSSFTSSPTFTRTSTPVPPTLTSTSTATVTRTNTPGISPTPGGGLQGVIFPNPASGTSVQVQVSGLTTTTKVSLQVFTTAMRKVNEVTYHSQGPGTVVLTLPLTDTTGAALANGVYYVVIRADNQRATLKLLVLR